jgi:hypothetical protein
MKERILFFAFTLAVATLAIVVMVPWEAPGTRESRRSE